MATYKVVFVTYQQEVADIEASDAAEAWALAWTLRRDLEKTPHGSIPARPDCFIVDGEYHTVEAVLAAEKIMGKGLGDAKTNLPD